MECVVFDPIEPVVGSDFGTDIFFRGLFFDPLQSFGVRVLFSFNLGR